MTVELISPPLLRQALRAWRNAQPLPPELMQLNLLETAGSTVEREVFLFEQIHTLAWNALLAARTHAGLERPAPPGSIDELLAALKDDFGCNDSRLESWSALYARYLVPFPVSLDEAAGAANITPRQFRRRVAAGLEYLAAALRRTELEARKQYRSLHLRRHLPPPDYARLFGVEKFQQTAARLLTQEDGPRFVSLEGIGGIGKTVLARTVAVHLAEHADLEDILWISARQEWVTADGRLETVVAPVHSAEDMIARLTVQLGQNHLAGLSAEEKLERLQPLLNNVPYLVVLDNLETLAELETLLPALYPLAGKSRFLLTSRHTLRHFPYVHVVPLAELSFRDSRALLESELNRRGFSRLFSDSGMEKIYAAIGGLPLAIKLVAAQMGHLPLTQILEGLQRARGVTAEMMYRYIYRRTWLLLGDPARALLLSMLLVSPDGEDLHWLRLSSALPDSEFEEAMAQLNHYALLEVTGDFDTPIYRLHRLTITFLQTDVLAGWEQRSGQTANAGSL